jgi:hypothetical protein
METLENADGTAVCEYSALLDAFEALPYGKGQWAWWVLGRALEERIGCDVDEQVQLALSVGLEVGRVSSYETLREAGQAVLRLARDEEWMSVPEPLKPPAGDWYIWAPMPAIFRWIRSPLSDPDEGILYELRRKWTDQEGGHRWKITLYPMDGTEHCLGYITDLDEAKAFADEAWAAWPTVLEVPNAD